MPNINVNVSIATPCPQLFLKPLSWGCSAFQKSDLLCIVYVLYS